MDKQLGLDAYLVASHTALALFVAIVHEIFHDYPLPAKILALAVYIAIAVYVYRKLRNRRIAKEKEQLDKLKRYQYLQSHMLEVVGEFLKDRYQASHELAVKIQSSLKDGKMTVQSLVAFLQEFDSKRREQIKSALSKLSSFLPGDDYKKPEDPDQALEDHLKVSFYAVEFDKNANEEVLLPKYRYYPNEREPRTQRFRRTDGASGKAWVSKRIVVCENGGDDPLFQDMWPGGGQKAQYASMICVPAIEDIPADRISEVYGILTIDTPVRRGYFQAKLGQFWADLFQPICDILVYCRESEQKKLAIVDAISALCPIDNAASLVEEKEPS